jgi:imidazoleglycerol-phosphate dehydratase
MPRYAEYERVTNETSISVAVNIDGKGEYEIDTGIAFIDHLIASLAKHSLIDLRLKCISKDNIRHHLIEDTAIALAVALDKALASRDNIERFGYAIVPMDDALTIAAVDLVKRSYCNIDLKIVRDSIEDVAREDIEHFFNSFAKNLNACIHVIVQYGSNDHHKVESAFKALAIALRNAMSINPSKGVASTKGVL